MWRKTTPFTASFVFAIFFLANITPQMSQARGPLPGNPTHRGWVDRPSSMFRLDINSKEMKNEFDYFITSLKNKEGRNLFEKFPSHWGLVKMKPSKGFWEEKQRFFDTKTTEEKNRFRINVRRGKLRGKFSLDLQSPYGCEDERGFHFEGETWYSRGCRRHKCLHFRGKYFVETDSCDVEIFNTTYKCIIQANLQENYPKCCPRYVCNPDNLGNRINVA